MRAFIELRIVEINPKILAKALDQCKKAEKSRRSRIVKGPDEKIMNSIQEIIEKNVHQVLNHRFQGVGNSQNKSVETGGD